MQSEDLVVLDELTPEKVEKASRYLLGLSRDNIDKYKFKMTMNYGALLYRNDDGSREQITVFFHKLITLD